MTTKPATTASRLRSALALGVSMCALCAGVLVESQPLGVGLALARGLGEADVHVVRPASPASAASTTAPDAAAAVADLPAGLRTPEGMLLPSFEGMDLGDAFARADTLGLRLVARDRWGERVPRDYASDYTVRRQRTAPGELVQDGDRVHLRVRVDRLVQGY